MNGSILTAPTRQQATGKDHARGSEIPDVLVHFFLRDFSRRRLRWLRVVRSTQHRPALLLRQSLLRSFSGRSGEHSSWRSSFSGFQDCPGLARTQPPRCALHRMAVRAIFALDFRVGLSSHSRRLCQLLTGSTTTSSRKAHPRSRRPVWAPLRPRGRGLRFVLIYLDWGLGVDAPGHTVSQHVCALQGVLCLGRRRVRPLFKGATNPTCERRVAVSNQNENRKSPHSRGSEVGVARTPRLGNPTAHLSVCHSPRSGVTAGLVHGCGCPCVSSVVRLHVCGE